MKYGLMSYGYLDNLGNEIQSIAARRFLPKVDYFVDFNNLSLFQDADEKFKMFMNAWYLHEEKSWPPKTEFIDPLLISMHLNINGKYGSKSFLSEESRDFLLKYGPVGARDPATRDFFLDNDIPSYCSGCMTLTLKGNGKKDLSPKDEYIVLVDVSDEVKSYIRTKTDKKIFNVSHQLPIDLNRRNKKYIKMQYMYDRVFNEDEKFLIAENLLNLYENASCVITKRLHVALPCLSLNTPVMVLSDDIINGEKRFSGLNELFRFYTFDEYKENFNIFDVNNPEENSKDYLKYKKPLIKKAKEFTGYESETYHTFDSGNIDSIKINNYLFSKSIKSLKEKDQLFLNLEKEHFTKLNFIKNKNIEQEKIINEFKTSTSWKLTKPLRNLKNNIKK